MYYTEEGMWREPHVLKLRRYPPLRYMKRGTRYMYYTEEEIRRRGHVLLIPPDVI